VIEVKINLRSQTDISKMQSLMENLWIFLFYMAVNHAAFYGCQGKKTPKCYEGDKSSNLNSAFQKAS